VNQSEAFGSERSDISVLNTPNILVLDNPEISVLDTESVIYISPGQRPGNALGSRGNYDLQAEGLLHTVTPYNNSLPKLVLSGIG